MEIDISKNFHKRYQKLSPKLQGKVKEALKTFAQNPHHKNLNNHALIGKWTGYRSINITGDYRAVYLPATENLARFYTLGSHSSLYR